MKRFLGYTLTTIGLIAFVFFLKYEGTTIPLKELWIVLSFFVMATGIYLIIKQKWQKLGYQAMYDNRISQISDLRFNGERIKLTLDNCEVKTRTFQKEVANKRFPAQIEMPDALYDDNRNYKTEEVRQTYIVFYKQYGDKTYKFISQATAHSAGTLKRYMDSQGGVDLFVDKTNPGTYYFDLPFM